MNLFEYSVYISSASVVLPIAVTLYGKPKFKNEYVPILFCALCLSALSDLLSYVIVFAFHLSNVPLLNFFIIGQFLLFVWMYYKLSGTTDHKYLKSIAFVVLILFIINSTFGQGLSELQTVTNSVSALILSIISIRFFKHLNQLPAKAAGKDAVFNSLYFINVAIFSYFSLNFWLFTISPALMELFNEVGLVNLWAFHNASNILKNILFAVGIYWAGVKE